MSLQTIEIEAFSGPTSVLIGGGNQPTIVYINQGPAGSAGSSTWGGITGTLSSQTDLQDALDLKANLASPTFTGTVVLPSATSIGNVSATEIGYVDGVTSAIQTQLNAKAPLASPTFTGIVTAPRIEGKCAGLELFSKAGQAINAGQVVYVTGASGTNIIIGLAQANTESTSSRTIGISESTLANNATGYVITEGLMTVSISSATALVGDPIWLSGTTAGGMLFGAANKPVYPYHQVYLGVVTRKTGNTIVEIYVKVQNGFELDELSDVLITTPLANQALVRNSDKWINRALVSNDISDSSTGGNGAADAGKLVEFNSTGGVAVSTLNKVTITQPATSATLTIAEGISINAQGEITISSAGSYIITGTTGTPAPPPPTGGIITSSTGYISTTAGGSFSTGTGNLTGPNASGTLALINPSSGTQTFSGAQSFSSTTRPTSSGTGTPASNSLVTRADVDESFLDFDTIALRDDFVGGTDGQLVVGQLDWERSQLNGTGNWRPMTPNIGFGIGAIVTAAAFKSIQQLQFDASNGIGGGGFNFNLLANSSTRIKFRVQFSSLNARIDFGFRPYVALIQGFESRKLALNYTPVAAAWTSSTVTALNQFRRPTVSNGRKYYASVGGTTGATEPTWPLTVAGTVTDGTVTWTEHGFEGGPNLMLVYHTVAGETAGVVVNTGIAAAINTWYVVEAIWVSGSTWRFTVNGVPTDITTTGDLSVITPYFRIENTDAVVNSLSIDYFGLFSRITRP